MVFPCHAYLKANITDTIPGHKARQTPLLHSKGSNVIQLPYIYGLCASLVKSECGKKSPFFPVCTTENKHNPLNVLFFKNNFPPVLFLLDN